MTHPSGLFDQQSVDDPRHTEDYRLNLSDLAVEYLKEIGSRMNEGLDLFHHILSILHAPAYREDNAGPLKQDWPRIPLPETRDQLRASADLGRRLSALLNPQTDVLGVTSGGIRPELRAIAPITSVEGGQLDRDAGDLDVTAGWGYAGARNATMPGRGQAEVRPYSENERDVIDCFDSLEDPFKLLGERCVDVYLNDRAFWRCIPERVWDYTLGGYQVIKKWLSYREKDLLGRALTTEEVREVTNMARRIAAIRLMEPELDRNYREVAASAVS